MTGAYGPEEFMRDTNVPRETLARLEIYAAHLAKWQSRINLIGPATLPQLWQRHMLDSAQLIDIAAKLCAQPENQPGRPRVWLDLGAGAGFPGMVIAIITGDEVHLIESNAKKCAFLREIVRVTRADNVIIHGGRIEEIEPWPVDIITARAFAPLDRLFEYALPFFTASTTGLFLKGQHLEDELKEVTKSWNFKAQQWPSRSDEKGKILQVGGLKRVNG